MDRFVPRVDGLEHRLTPAVTPTQVNFALAYTQAVDDVIENLIPRLKYARTDSENLTIAVALRGMAQGAQDAGGVLGQFRVDLANQMAANPAGAGGMAGLSGVVANMQSRANVLSKTSETYGVGFGAAPLNFPTTSPTDSSTSSTTDTSSTSSTDTSSTSNTNTGSTTPTTLPEPAKDAVGLSVSIPPIQGPNVVTLPDGVKYVDVTTGTGTAVAAGGTLTAHYAGWLSSNGKEFDTSENHNGPTQFSLNQVIKGWQEAIPGMMPGGVRRLFIPAAEGYGAAGSGTSIPPNSDLVFEVIMVSSP
jgi:FKBP-type peptidyl-prolyl cis-trans isomerase